MVMRLPCKRSANLLTHFPALDLLPTISAMIRMQPDFQTIFDQLRGILKKNAGALTVKEDAPSSCWLETGIHPQLKKKICAAGVEIKKTYVSYHFMPIYARPDLKTGVSPALLARMQGKSCFNFQAVDQALFAELDELTSRSFARFRSGGFRP